MPDWDAEVVIDEELVTGLTGEQFPELDAGSARWLAEGWDNSVWVVEERWAFRFPRREVAHRGIAREMAVLPRLGPLLPAPIPVPTFLGSPSERFRWPFFGAPLLPGREAGGFILGDEERVEVGSALGRFLRVLHAPETREHVDTEAVPYDPFGRGDMELRARYTREWLDDAVRMGVWRPPARVGEILEAATALVQRRTPDALVHGDLHFRHVLVDGGALSAVIDWGDLCRGDRAIDLQLLWSYLPARGRTAFLSEYGTVGDDELLRARVLALNLCTVLAVHARKNGLVDIEREAVAGLERTLVDLG